MSARVPEKYGFESSRYNNFDLVSELAISDFQTNFILNCMHSFIVEFVLLCSDTGHIFAKRCLFSVLKSLYRSISS